MRTFEAARKAIKSVGFEVLHEEDLAERDDKVKWYTPLEGNIFKAQTFWDGTSTWLSMISIDPHTSLYRLENVAHGPIRHAERALGH